MNVLTWYDDGTGKLIPVVVIQDTVTTLGDPETEGIPVDLPDFTVWESIPWADLLHNAMVESRVVKANDVGEFRKNVINSVLAYARKRVNSVLDVWLQANDGEFQTVSFTSVVDPTPNETPEE